MKAFGIHTERGQLRITNDFTMNNLLIGKSCIKESFRGKMCQVDIACFA